MKHLRLMVVMVFMGIMSACGEHVPTISQPPTSTHSLETAEAYLIRGDSFSANKDYGQAIMDYDQAIRLNPAYAEAYNNRGYAYYWSGDATQAIADYSRAIELRPNYAANATGTPQRACGAYASRETNLTNQNFESTYNLLVVHPLLTPNSRSIQ
jgi:tetratricopeptide (TPR) repeat protein